MILYQYFNTIYINVATSLGVLTARQNDQENYHRSPTKDEKCVAWNQSSIATQIVYP